MVNLLLKLRRDAAGEAASERRPEAIRQGSCFWVLLPYQPSILLELSACYPILTWPQTHGCVYECFFWKQLLHKLFDRILASGILCTIIFWRKLSLSSFNNCFICCFLWYNSKLGWYWFKNLNCLVVKLIEITAFHFKRVLDVLDDFFICLCCGACEYFCCFGPESRLLHILLKVLSVTAVGSLQSLSAVNPDLEEGPLGS